MTSFSQYLQVYRLMRPVIPEPLRRPIVNLLPSRRVKRFLNIVDTLHEYATKIYTEKKHVADSMGAEEEDEKAKDLITILRKRTTRTGIVSCYLTQNTSVRANAGASVEDALSEDEVIAQLSYGIIVILPFHMVAVAHSSPQFPHVCRNGHHIERVNSPSGTLG